MSSRFLACQWLLGPCAQTRYALAPLLSLLGGLHLQVCILLEGHGGQVVSGLEHARPHLLLPKTQLPVDRIHMRHRLRGHTTQDSSAKGGELWTWLIDHARGGEEWRETRRAASHFRVEHDVPIHWWAGAVGALAFFRLLAWGAHVWPSSRGSAAPASHRVPQRVRSASQQLSVDCTRARTPTRS